MVIADDFDNIHARVVLHKTEQACDRRVEQMAQQHAVNASVSDNDNPFPSAIDDVLPRRNDALAAVGRPESR